MARLESGKVRPNLDWHDARDLVQTTLRELRRELASHPVKLELPTAPLLVRLDFSLMQHALANLLLNAVESHAAGNVRVTVRQRSSDRRRSQLVLVCRGSRAGHPGGDFAARLRQVFPRAQRTHGRQRTRVDHREGLCRSPRRIGQCRTISRAAGQSSPSACHNPSSHPLLNPDDEDRNNRSSSNRARH